MLSIEAAERTTVAQTAVLAAALLMLEQL